VDLDGDNGSSIVDIQVRSCPDALPCLVVIDRERAVSCYRDGSMIVNRARCEVRFVFVLHQDNVDRGSEAEVFVL